MISVNDDIRLERLPFATTSFRELREQNQIYIDKTDLIAKIASLKGPYFFARPRRFGKSLLLNTFKTLFLDGLENFRGLAIEHLWNDTTYKVIQIDFSLYSRDTAEDLVIDLTDELLTQTGFAKEISKLNDVGKYIKPGNILKEIADKISDRNYVLLIDEYDALITHHLDDKDELVKILDILNNFYSAVKSCLEKFRFVFITGITRIAHISIFSAFNNLRDITLEKEFANLLGITNDELGKYFNPFIERASSILNITVEDTYTMLKSRYDGFNFVFDSKETLYNPWSIINFLLKPIEGFENYWFDSGGTPSILMNYLKINKDFDLWEYSDKKLKITKNELSAKSDPFNIKPKILLTQAGYFSLCNDEYADAKLQFPNMEVEESMLRLYLSVNGFDLEDDIFNMGKKVIKLIDRHDIDGIIKVFNGICNECASSKSKFFTDENTLRDLIFAAIPNGIDLFKQKERQYVLGRSDLEFITSKTHLVMEFKLTRPNKSAKTAMKEGIEQIRSRRYGELAFSTHKLLRLVLVFSHKDKCILPEFSCEVKDS